PLLHAKLTIRQLIADSLVQTASDQSLRIVYDNVISNLSLDSVFQIRDTTINTTSVQPFIYTVQPGTQFYTNNNNVVLGVTAVQLNRASISSGKIRISIKNTLPSKINFTYTIPKAKRNGVPFTVYASTDSGSVATPAWFTHDYDFSGYDVDMTGADGL